MTLAALKLTKENLPTIAEKTGVNPESIKHLAAMRDHYVLWQTETLTPKDNWRLMSEATFRLNLEFTAPESNQFTYVRTR